MDPITGASALASIVGLIGQFKSGRDAARSEDFSEFMQWLIESNQSELKSMIEANQTTTISIKAILNQNQSKLESSLAQIGEALATFTSTIDGFSGLSKSLLPGAVLSDQAIHILTKFEAAQAGAALIVESISDDPHLLFLDANGGVAISEPRFLQNDLDTLVSLGLLTQGRNSSGKIIFNFTRAASRFVTSLHDSPA
ncbi:hypothetical protein QAO71_10415 [Halopseudomonas sp. SMJS2]|uniref:hypothetical protein n=1 Tax=Halopseudomonas sp. SMJS2 TaxID=3041098 RepID=UPI002453324E|nr:hypothetical protein [Halopseudomonas sp. SMJS2]WGK60506.1 hypothetical protein QAO71_10415 [Halopseudomonas sp. SMJS2]